MPPPVRRAAQFGIRYRPMSERDYAFIETLYASTRADELAPLDWTDAMKRDFLAQQHRAQHHHYQNHYPGAEWLIIEREGEAIGRLYLAPFPGTLRIVDIALIPEMRRRSLGTAILKDVIELASDQGRGVSIHVEKNNPARSLYASLGFTVRADVGAYDLMERDADRG